MRGFGTLTLAFFLSGFIAGVLQLQLGIWFKADLELALAIVALFLFTAAASIVFGVILVSVGTPAAINRAAVALFVLMMLALIGLEVAAGLSARSAQDFKRDLPILLYIVAPSTVMLFIPWWLVRRAARARAAAT